MPTIDIIIISGIISMNGLGVRSLAVNMKTTMPSMATIMTTGINFMMMLPGIVLGTSGGGSRCTSPPGGRGAASLGDRLNCSVLTERTPLRLGD